MNGDEKGRITVSYLLVCAFLAVVPATIVAQSPGSGAMLAARGNVAVQWSCGRNFRRPSCPVT